MFLAVVCPHCQMRVNAPADAAGRVVGCPCCGKAFAIDPPRNWPSETPEPPIRYICPRCRRSLESPASMAGQKHKCPGCGQRLQIPTSAQAVPSHFNRTILAPVDDGGQSQPIHQTTNRGPGHQPDPPHSPADGYATDAIESTSAAQDDAAPSDAQREHDPLEIPQVDAIGRHHKGQSDGLRSRDIVLHLDEIQADIADHNVRKGRVQFHDWCARHVAAAGDMSVAIFWIITLVAIMATLGVGIGLIVATWGASAG